MIFAAYALPLYSTETEEPTGIDCKNKEKNRDSNSSRAGKFQLTG